MEDVLVFSPAVQAHMQHAKKAVQLLQETLWHIRTSRVHVSCTQSVS